MEAGCAGFVPFAALPEASVPVAPEVYVVRLVLGLHVLVPDGRHDLVLSLAAGPRGSRTGVSAMPGPSLGRERALSDDQR